MNRKRGKGRRGWGEREEKEERGSGRASGARGGEGLNDTPILPRPPSGSRGPVCGFLHHRHPRPRREEHRHLAWGPNHLLGGSSSVPAPPVRPLGLGFSSVLPSSG